MPALPPSITSRTNAKVKALREVFKGKASRPGELAGIEGYNLLTEAYRAQVQVDTLFVRAGDTGLLAEAALSRHPPREVLVLAGNVFDSVVNTASPQQIAATVVIPALRNQRRGAGTRMLLVLEHIQDPGNVGTLLRSAEGLSTDEVFLTPGCANHWSPKAIRASAGSVFRQPVTRLGIRETLETLRRQGIRIAGAVAGQEGATLAPLAQLRWPLALVIGNEGSGLSAEAIALLDERVNIPCGVESLNAAVAGSLLLYEAQRQALFSPAAPAAAFPRSRNR